MPVLTSPINKALVLRGVTPASVPMLSGRVLHERQERVNLRVTQATPVIVHMRVVRSNITNTLLFEYRLAMPESDYDEAIKMSVSFFGREAKVTFADFRVDSPGVMMPNYFESAPDEMAAFRFDYGLSVGRDSRFCTLGTDAREFDEAGGTLKLVTGKTSVSVKVPAPLGTGVLKAMPMPEVEVEALEKEPEAGAKTGGSTMGRAVGAQIP